MALAEAAPSHVVLVFKGGMRSGVPSAYISVPPWELLPRIQMHESRISLQSPFKTVPRGGRLGAEGASREEACLLRY